VAKTMSLLNPPAYSKGFMVYANFNIVSVIYHYFAVGRGFRRLMFYDTFNIVSVI
jgi:hypothetical protein